MNATDQTCRYCDKDFRSSVILLKNGEIICGPCAAEDPSHLARVVCHAAELAMGENRGKGSPFAAMRYVGTLPDDWQVEAGAAVRYVYAHGKYPPLVAQARAEAKARARAEAAA